MDLQRVQLRLVVKQSQAKTDVYLAISFLGQGLALDRSYEQLQQEEKSRDLFMAMLKNLPVPMGRW